LSEVLKTTNLQATLLKLQKPKEEKPQKSWEEELKTLFKNFLSQMHVPVRPSPAIPLPETVGAIPTARLDDIKNFKYITAASIPGFPVPDQPIKGHPANEVWVKIQALPSVFAVGLQMVVWYQTQDRLNDLVLIM